VKLSEKKADTILVSWFYIKANQGFGCRAQNPLDRSCRPLNHAVSAKIARLLAGLLATGALLIAFAGKGSKPGLPPAASPRPPDLLITNMAQVFGCCRTRRVPGPSRPAWSC